MVGMFRPGDVMDWFLSVHGEIDWQTLLWPRISTVSCINFPWSNITGLEVPDEQLLLQLSLDSSIFRLIVDIVSLKRVLDQVIELTVVIRICWVRSKDEFVCKGSYHCGSTNAELVVLFLH